MYLKTKIKQGQRFIWSSVLADPRYRLGGSDQPLLVVVEQLEVNWEVDAIRAKSVFLVNM